MAGGLYAFFRPQFEALHKWLKAQRIELLAAQAARQAEAEKATVLTGLGWTPDDLGGLLYANIDDMLDEIMAQAKATIGDYYKQDMGVELSWEVYDQAAADWAKDYKFGLIKDLNDSTRQQLGKAISRWITTDEDFDSLVKRVWQIVPTDPYPMHRDRAQVIAATEVTRIYAESRWQGMQAAGLKQSRWRTAMDELVCPYCGPLGKAGDGDGAVSGPDGKFVDPVTGNKVDKPPRHVGCRCWIVEDTDELDALAQQQMESAPKPIAPKKPAKPKIPKPKPAKPVAEPEPDVPWKPAMTLDEAAQWTYGPFKGQQVYAQVQAFQYGKVAAGGLPTQNVFGDAVVLYSEQTKPPNAVAGKINIPVQVNVKRPYVAQSEFKTVQWAMGQGWDNSQEPLTSFLQAKGYDALAILPKPGLENLTNLYVFHPSNAVTTINRYGKPSTSAAKPKKPKAPKAPITPAALPPAKTFDLAAMDLDDDLLLAKDLHAAGSPWGPVKGRGSYGGIVFDDQGRVLLRKPAGEFGGYAWTFPKGGIEPNEHALTAAIREVGEETGHKGQVIGFVPGTYKGTSTRTSFFLMRSTGIDPALMDPETEELRWVTKSEAVDLIKQGKTKTGIKRDLEALDAAVAEFDKLQDPLYRNQVKQQINGLPDAKVKPKLAPVVKPLAGFPHEPAELVKIGAAPGASHAAYLYDAPDGSRWMFKPQDDFMAQIDQTAYKMAAALGHEGAETYTVKVGGESGSIQRWYPDVKTTVGGLGGVVSPEQVVRAQKEAIFDWLIGNNDGHSQNLLVLQSGKVVGIDKGQAFKFWEKDKLDWDYNPNPTHTWHNTVLKQYAEGGNVYLAGAEHPELAGFLDRIQNLDDDEFKRILRPYAEAAIKSLPGRGTAGRRTALPFDDVDTFLASAVARKNSIKRDWTDYYAKAKAARAKALGIAVEVGEPDAMTPIDAALVAEVKASGWQGKTILLGGSDVENMTALVYEIEGDGTVIDMKLRRDAEARMFARLGHVPTAAMPAANNINDPYWADVQTVAKSYNHHYKPGQDQIVPEKTKEAIAKLYNKLSMDDSPLAKHYLDYISPLSTDVMFQEKKLIGTVISQYVPPPPKQERVEARSPRRFDVKAEKPNAMGVRNEAGRIILDAKRATTFKGSGLAVQLDDEISAEYIGHGDGNDNIYSKQGQLRFVLQGKASEEKLKRVVGYMTDIGLDGRLATRQDTEWMYLVKTTYAAGVDPTKIAPPTLPIPEQMRKYQEFWNKRLGVTDVTKLPSYQPEPHYDKPAASLKGAEGAFGLPRWRRFDIDDAAFKQQMGDYALVHTLYSGGDVATAMRTMLRDNGGLVATEEKFRIGVQIGGMSPDHDQRTGGASYVFTRLATKARANTANYQFQFDTRLLLDTDVISYNHDAYGNATPEYISQHRKRTPTEWQAASNNSSNEVIIKRNLSFADYLTGVNVLSEADRLAVIEELRAAGITKLGGKKIEDAVKVRGYS